MPFSTSLSVPLILALFFSVVVDARTDLTGCTTTDLTSPAGASVAWYVPGTGELCDFLDCGGGAGPPRYDVPGCAQYTGTATYSPSYLAGYSAAAAATGGSGTGNSEAIATTSTSSSEILSAAMTLSSPTTASMAFVETTSSGSTYTGSTSMPTPGRISSLQTSSGSEPDNIITSSSNMQTDTTSASTDSGTDILTSSISSKKTASGSTSSGGGGLMTSSVSNKATTSGSASGITKTPTGSSSTGASTGVSTGAAAGMTGVIGGLGVLVAALGSVVIL